MKTDIFIKDEGEMITVCFQTDDAIKAVNKQPSAVTDALYGSVNYKKLDLEASQRSLIVAWSMSESLTFDSDVVINLHLNEKS